MTFSFLEVLSIKYWRFYDLFRILKQVLGRGLHTVGYFVDGQDFGGFKTGLNSKFLR